MAGIRGGADKSLARPTSRCRRTESIVVGKRGLFMCRIASLFLLQRLQGSMSGDARDFNHIETRAVLFLISPISSYCYDLTKIISPVSFNEVSLGVSRTYPPNYAQIILIYFCRIGCVIFH